MLNVGGDLLSSVGERLSLNGLLSDLQLCTVVLASSLDVCLLENLLAKHCDSDLPDMFCGICVAPNAVFITDINYNVGVSFISNMKPLVLLSYPV